MCNAAKAGFWKKLFTTAYTQEELNKACNASKSEGYNNGVKDTEDRLKQVVDAANTQKDNLVNSSRELSELANNYENLVSYFVATVMVNFPELVGSTKLSELDGQELKDAISDIIARYRNSAITMQNKVADLQEALDARDDVIAIQKQMLDKIEAVPNIGGVVEEDLGCEPEPEPETPTEEQPEETPVEEQPVGEPEEPKEDEAGTASLPNTRANSKTFKINRRKIPAGMKTATEDELQAILRMKKSSKLSYQQVFDKLEGKFTLVDISKFCRSH